MRFDLFKYVVMFFGLYNSLISFQHYINNTLREYLNIFCTVYLDNILIYSEDKLEYKVHTRKILSRL